jgi:N-methylhydantoinase A
MKLDESRTRDFADRAKGKITCLETFAEGIVKLADMHMERALRKISVEQGYDPRDFTLVSFGGAGPMHACSLARALRIPKVLVPNMPGALSAYGILVSDVIRDYSRTLMLKPEDESIPGHFEFLEQQGRRDMESEGLHATAARSLDLRYAGQGYELPVPWSADFVSNFHRTHEQRYGYADERRQVEVVNARVRMIATTAPIDFARHELKAGNGSRAILKRKPVYFGEWIAGTVYDRDALYPGDRFSGPAVIVEYSATTFLPPDCIATVDAYSNLVIEVRQ